MPHQYKNVSLSDKGNEISVQNSCDKEPGELNSTSSLDKVSRNLNKDGA